MRPAAGRGAPGELRAFMTENPGSRSPHVGPVYLDGPTCHLPLIPSTQDCQVPARSLVVQGFLGSPAVFGMGLLPHPTPLQA